MERTTWGSNVLVAVLVLTALTGCNNSNYPDLMRVTARADETIATLDATYRGTDPLSARIQARNKIVQLREWQLAVLKRINPRTMPEFESGGLNWAQADEKKKQLVDDAVKRVQEAKALPMPTATAKPATPTPTSSTAASSTPTKSKQ